MSVAGTGDIASRAALDTLLMCGLKGVVRVFGCCHRCYVLHIFNAFAAAAARKVAFNHVCGASPRSL